MQKVSNFIERAIQTLWLITIICCAVVITAHCTTTTKPQSNAFGALVYKQNPHVYLFGAVVDIADMGGATNVRFNPARTYSFFSESVLFCGDVSDRFSTPGAIVVTYRRNAARLYNGVPCYELESVDKVQSTVPVTVP